MSYEVLARKYRPSNFEEVVGQSHIIQALSNSITQDKIHQAYIFSGTRGVGKTTLARILSKCLNCLSAKNPVTVPCDTCNSCVEIKAGRHLDFLEIDAASRTGVDDMRSLLETVQYKPSTGRYKIYLIDEVHMLSTSSFNALLKTLEEPPSHVIFIFATTDPEKIPKTVQSRCLQLNLKTIGKQALKEHMLNIVKKESIKHDEESLMLIADSAKGSVRDALTLLDQSIAHGNGALNEQDVRNLLGTIDAAMIGDLVSSIINGDSEKSFNIFYQIEELNPEYENILKSIVSFIHEVSLEQFLKNSNDENIIKIAERTDKEFIQLVYEIAVNAYSKFSIHPEPKQALEICILRMLAFNPIASIHESSSTTNTRATTEKKTLNIEQSTSKASLKNKAIDQKTLNTRNNDVLKIINTNNEWVDVFNKLQMSVFAKNYFGHLVFVKMENNTIYLEGDIENNKIPENVKGEFEKVCTESFAKDIKIDISHSTKKGGPLFIKEQEDIVKQNTAEKNIKNNDSIKDFMNRFDATLKDKSIKPTN